MMITDALPAEYFGRLANAAAKRFGFPRFPATVIREAMSPSEYRLPIMRRFDNGTIWIDRWYIAVQKEDGLVEYIYIAKSHILEEVASYREVKKERDDPASIPGDILRQFKKAREYMRYTGSSVYLSLTGIDLADAWLETYRKAERKAINAKKAAAERKKKEDENGEKERRRALQRECNQEEGSIA